MKNNKENNKCLFELILLIVLLVLVGYFLVPGVITTIYDIGKDVGEALAKWFAN